MFESESSSRRTAANFAREWNGRIKSTLFASSSNINHQGYTSMSVIYPYSIKSYVVVLPRKESLV